MSIFAIKTILSFIVGFIWITLSSIFAEKLGAKLGGVIAGLPATMVVALFFIGLTQGGIVASHVTTVIPLVVSINALFVVAFISFSKRFSLIVALSLAIIFWFCVMLLISLFPITSFLLILSVSCVIILTSYSLLEKRMRILAVGSKKTIYSFSQILIRGGIGGTIIVFSVLMSKISNPTIAGIFASFPALTISMIIIIHQTQTKAFLHSLLKNFIISSTVNVVGFVICIRYLFPVIGIYMGTVVALVASAFIAYLMYNFVNKRLS